MDLSLPAFLAIAVLGVSAVLALIYALAGPSPRLPGEARAREIFRAEHPDARVAAVGLDREGRAALLALEGSEQVGLVRLLGDRPVVRLLAPAAVRRVRVGPEGELRLEIRDFTFPRLALRLADRAEAQAWARRLGGGDLPGSPDDPPLRVAS